MIVVRASAGTGKTYRISVEFISTLLKMGAHTGFTRDDIYREILVITFTRKATSEIRERIFEHLGAIARREDGFRDILKNPLDDRQIDFLGRVFDSMRKNKHLLMIRTIDGFTQLVFQQLVAPAMQIDEFSIVNENDEDVYQRILEKIIRDDDTMTAFSSVFQKYIHRGKDLSAYRKLIQSMIDNRWLFDFQGMLNDGQPNLTHNSAYSRFADEMSNLVDDICRIENEKPVGLFKAGYVKDLIAGSDAEPGNVRSKLPVLLQPDILRIHAAKFKLETLLYKNYAKKYRERYLEDVFPHLIEGVIEDIRREERIIRIIARIVSDEYDRIKIEQREFTHNDILWYTYRALHQDEMGLIDPATSMVTNLFYEFLSQRVRYIFIDEFQDTSILQWKLLEPLLIELSSGYGVEDYGGFVIVGDEKQAIYGWRGGERELLDRVKTVFHSVEEETLATCYRSQREILRFVNDYFGTVSRVLDDGVWQYRDVQHLPKKNEGYVEVRFDHHTRSKNAPREKEQCYRDFVDKMVAPRIADGAHDSVILARTNRDLDQIAQALDDAGIPYIHESSASLADHRLVKPLIHLLRYLAWYDFLDLLIFLRSDYYRMDNDLFNRVLLWYRENEQPEHTIDCLKRMAAEIAGCSLTELTDFLSGFDGVSQLFRILSDTISRYGSTGWSTVDLRNLARFMDYVQRFDSGVYDFLRELEKRRGDDALGQVGLEESGAIRLMTIHKSKGLQFDSTFVYLKFSNRGGGAGTLDLQTFYRLSEYGASPTDLIMCNSEYVSVLKNCLSDTEEKSFQRINDLMEHHALTDFTDEINALYVALTRAKNNLFVYTVQEASDLADGMKKAQQERGTIKSLLGLLYRVVREGIGEDGVYRSGGFTCSKDVPEELEHKPVTEISSVMRHVHPQNAYREAAVTDPKDAHLLIQAYKSDSIFKGEAVHLCLSMVKTGTEEEFEAARDAVYRDFGGMYSIEKIDAVIDGLRSWTQEHQEIFSSDWSRVFNEISVFGEDGNEYRIDRLLIDDARKRILIVDYKTGGVADPWQERKYVELVNGMKQDGYTVGFRYAEVMI